MSVFVNFFLSGYDDPDECGLHAWAAILVLPPESVELRKSDLFIFNPHHPSFMGLQPPVPGSGTSEYTVLEDYWVPPAACEVKVLSV